MTPGYELFQRWKTAKNLRSDNAGAIALGLSRATVSGWKKGDFAPSLESVKRMSKDLREDYKPVALVIEATRASTPELSALLKEVATAIGKVAALILMGVISWPNNTDADENTKSVLVHNATKYNFTYCEQSIHSRRYERRN